MVEPVFFFYLAILFVKYICVYITTLNTSSLDDDDNNRRANCKPERSELPIIIALTL